MSPCKKEYATDYFAMKVMFIYPNKNGFGTIPLGISMISARLEEDGHKTLLFDSTFFTSRSMNFKDKREEVGTHIKTDLGKYVTRIDASPEQVFEKMVIEEEPDIVGLSAVSYNFPEGLRYLKLLKNLELKHKPLTIVGGTHPTVAPEKTIAIDDVDAICVGEGELAMAELTNKLQNGEDYSHVQNMWVKVNGKTVRNPARQLTQLDELPFPDYSLFDDSHFIKPFVGKVYRIGHFELSRGCPYQCTYCVNKYYQDLFKDGGSYHRVKSIERSIEELRDARDKYNVQLVKFWDETFLVMRNDRLFAFLDTYKREINLPFMINTRAETINEDRISAIKDAGCVAISVGIEAGNDIIRKKIMNRRIEKEAIIKAFKIINKHKIRTSAFNMLGMPFESRRTVFETIELNRSCKPTTQTINIFYPYEGTLLRKVCIDLGIIDKDPEMVDFQSESILEMPQISKEELIGLRRTFVLYCKLPKVFYPLIYFAEKSGNLRNHLHTFLIWFMQKFFDKQVGI
jgi:anaerobic magnesium-protoporphyrin IX monomethyl ester cyclase